MNFSGIKLQYNFIQPANDIATIVATGGANSGYLNGPGNIYHDLEKQLPEKNISFLRINVTDNYENGNNQVYHAINYFLGKKNLRKGWSSSDQRKIYALGWRLFT